ncbi:MAG: ATP-binding cassette domain-containing protein [Legionellales bacterium]|nr:ATP-binding cassette domain-containing protein [Legionellales bacterium]
MSEAKPIIEIRNLSTFFGDKCIHHNIDLTVYSREILAIVGGSGSGKTTLMREMLMLHPPTRGSITLFNHDITQLSFDERQKIQPNIGVMFQQGALFSSLTVQENIAFPLTLHTQLSKKMIDEIALIKMQLVGLPLSASQLYPAELSGGMIKRVAVARAIARDPTLLFLDEPTAGLDPNGAGALDDLILELHKTLGLTIILVTHDLDTLWKVSHRVAFLGQKKVLAVDSMSALTQSNDPDIHAYFNSPRAKNAQAAYL